LNVHAYRRIDPGGGAGLKTIPISLFAFALLVVVPMPADADMWFYSDKALFLATTGAVAEAPIPNAGLVSTPVTVGNLVFTISSPSTQLYLGTGDPTTQWSTLLTGHEIAISGPENLNVVDSLNPIYAIGFDFHEPTVNGQPPAMPDVCNAACVDSTFTATLKLGAAVVGATTFNAADDVAAFVGILSSSPFNRIEIFESRGGIDNEFYGRFYTSTTPVPEPSTWILLATCGGLTAVLRRRYRK
jgi:hypothetical protein